MVWNSGFLEFVQRIGSQNEKKGDDDSVDRLNHRYTFALVMVFLVLVAGKQYVGQPIECWVPKEFSGDWQTYTENYCWIKSTYWVPSEAEVLPDVQDRDDNIIGYYQWVPFILLGIALSFNVPRTVWKLCNWHSGIQVQLVIDEAAKASDSTEQSARDKSISAVARSLEDVILRIDKSPGFFSRVKRWLCCLFASSSHSGNFLCSLYLVVKLLYMVNVVVQLYLMTNFLGTDGFQILNDLTGGHQWHESGHFPRVTMCDFSIRSLGQKTKNYTVQCVLMINLFNEKIFLTLWLWYFLLFVLVVVSFFYWFWALFSTGQREHYVRHMLRTRQEYKDRYEAALQDFVKRRLAMDGVFILRLIEANAGELVATDVAVHMWRKYKPNSRYIDPNDQDLGPQPESSELLSKADSSEPPINDVFV